MGHRAGVTAANLEFNQFHPTCLYHLESSTFLLTEALRGEGAKLKLPNISDFNINGKSCENEEKAEFMHKYHHLKELAPRDIVARAIDAEMKKYSLDYVHLDISAQNSEF